MNRVGRYINVALELKFKNGQGQQTAISNHLGYGNQLKKNTIPYLGNDLVLVIILETSNEAHLQKY